VLAGAGAAHGACGGDDEGWRGARLVDVALLQLEHRQVEAVEPEA